MPAFRDLDELIKNLIKKEEEKLRRIEEEFEKEFKGFSSPLYSFRETDESYEYLIDMPKANLSTLKVESRPRKLYIACKTKDGKEYRLNITLPEDADPATMDVSKAKWLLKVTIKKRK
ncbi:hypothetical protein SJAV_22010 [Sulfurisphaera javensis]|uniref:ArsA HSP20-like domain-containing protein n=1 Tax=Sulfurisphaera javensis TaxID=2049879 RepID=A0AAT9GTH3_9CREN